MLTARNDKTNKIRRIHRSEIKSVLLKWTSPVEKRDTAATQSITCSGDRPKP